VTGQRVSKYLAPLLLSFALVGQALAAPALKAGVFDPPRAAPPLPLQATTGKPFNLADYRGKVVILAFGYTHCTAVCPVTLAALAQANKLLGPDAGGVQVLFVSVDPERDSVARMREYLAGFDNRFMGLSGSPAETAAALSAYGISATRHPIAGGKDYVIGHSSYLYFIDRKGMLRALLPFGRPASDIAHDARLLLGER
jgi:protein SCO1/2